MPACALRPDMADCLGFRRRRIARKLRYFPMSNGRSVRPEGFEPPAALLRRQLLCPAELRAPERNCARPRSRDGYAKVAVCRPLAVQIRPRVRQLPTVPEPTVNDASHAKLQAAELRIRTNPAS